MQAKINEEERKIDNENTDQILLVLRNEVQKVTLDHQILLTTATQQPPGLLMQIWTGVKTLASTALDIVRPLHIPLVWQN